MAVDVFVGNPEAGARRFDIAPGEPHVTFDDDPYYWFMWPLFESLAERTGQLIDLYGGAVFRGDSLVALRQTMSEVRRLVSAKPDSWEVAVGWTDTSFKERRYATALRADFVRLLDDFEQVIIRAEQLGSSVLCIGD